MKFKKAILGCALALFSSVYAADNHHVYPNDKSLNTPAQSVQAKYAGFCEIEIINNSFDDVRVSGVFDDGIPLIPFSIYSFEGPHYISLFYYGYCHYGMNLFIDSYSGYNIYSAFTPRETTIRIYPYLKNKVKAELIKK